MENQSYYLIDLQDSDVCSLDEALQVNCTGYVKMTHPFATENMRRDWYLQLGDQGALETHLGTLTAGQFVLYEPQAIYRYTHLGAGTLGYYWAHFTGAEAVRLIALAGIMPNTIYTIDEERMAVLRREFSSLFRECMLRRGGYRAIAAATVTTLLIKLGRSVQTEAADDENMLRKRLESSVAQIHNHYTESLSVGDLARMEHLSESRFRELFRAAFGAPPGEYIIDLRIAHAMELLASTDLSIAEIAESCGYSDVLYFCRLFSRKRGLPPARYRKRYRQSMHRTESNDQTEETP